MKRPVCNVNVAVAAMKLISEPAPDFVRHRAVDKQHDDGPKRPLRKVLLHRDEQISSLVFVVIDLDIGIANDVKRVRRNNVIPWEKLVEVGSYKVFEPHELMLALSTVSILPARGNRN